MKKTLKHYLPLFHWDQWYWLPSKQRVYDGIDSWNWLNLEYMMLPEHWFKTYEELEAENDRLNKIINSFYETIKHGDAEHQAWLKLMVQQCIDKESK